MTYTAERRPDYLRIEIARRFAGYWPYGLIQSAATKIKMKAIANATKEKVISFVRLCMIAPPVRLRFRSVERLATFLGAIVRLPPITNCPLAVGRYRPELRTDVKIIRGSYHAPASTPLRKLSLIEIAERCRRLSMGAQGLRTTPGTSRRGGSPTTARRISPLAFLHAQHRCGLRVFRLDLGERTNTNSPATVIVGRGAKNFR